MGEIPRQHEPMAKAMLQNLIKRGYRIIGPAGTDVSEVIASASPAEMPPCTCDPGSRPAPWCDVHSTPSQAWTAAMARATGDVG